MSDWRESYHAHGLQASLDRGPIAWQNQDTIPNPHSQRPEQLPWGTEGSSFSVPGSSNFGRTSNSADGTMDASTMSNEELFSAIVRMDVPPAAASSQPSGLQNRHPSVSIEEAKTALKAARAAAGNKAAAKAEGNGDSNSDDEDGSPDGSVGKSKRVLANRQSAHRSRLRKLQYIQDLESNVNRLQQELGQLQPQLNFLREKYSGLSDQNRKLRDRVTALLNEAHFKECLNNSLRQEITQLNAIQAATASADGGVSAGMMTSGDAHGVLGQTHAFPSLKSQ